MNSDTVTYWYTQGNNFYLSDNTELRAIRLWERPDSWAGKPWEGWFVGLSRTRDSDALTRSNFEVFLKALRELPEVLVDDTNNAAASYRTEREDWSSVNSVFIVPESHWACGWIDWIAIHPSNEAAMKLADEMLCSLEDYPVLDEDGIAIDFEIEGEYPQFGNNDERVDSIACDLVERFMTKIQHRKTYRNAIPTQSVLTITSNVVYGKKTGNTPDGRRAGAPFGPGANPMHGRDQKGAVASLTSVAKLPFAYAKDGISYTFSIVPNALGKEADAQKANLVGLMDGYFHHEANIEGGQHLNVNVMNREMLLDAMENPEKYPQLTIRVSGYAVRFNSLTKEQQHDVITRTFTQSM